jgi:thiamine biosynthesis lipoprotein
MRLILCRALCTAALLVLAACGKPAPLQQESYVFGTRVEVTIAGVDEARARQAAAAVLAEFDRLHRLLHAWQPSAVTELNAAIAAGRPHEVPEEVAALLRDAQGVARDGDRLFDPGIGALVRLWGFHADEFVARLPADADIAAWLKSRPSVLDLTIAGRTVTSSNRDVAIDLGGYAKGYALDRALALLRAQGVGNALVNIGGNVIALGDKNGVPWRVGIRHPRTAGHLATLELRDGEAIGTSGDYQRYFELGGARYSHLLDPRTGRPATGTAALTILLPPGPRAGTLSDASSKPLFLAGPGRVAELAQRLGVAAVLRVDADGKIELSSAMRPRLTFLGENPRLEVLR